MLTISSKAGKELSRLGLASLSQIVAAAVTHEVGHALLGGAHAHASSGVMKAAWNRDDLGSIAADSFHFSKAQWKPLQMAHRERTHAAALVALSPSVGR